jgi:hypothetical protein
MRFVISPGFGTVSEGDNADLTNAAEPIIVSITARSCERTSEREWWVASAPGATPRWKHLVCSFIVFDPLSPLANWLLAALALEATSEREHGADGRPQLLQVMLRQERLAVRPQVTR